MPTELNISLNTNTETPTIKFVLTDDLAATLSGSTTDVASSIKYVATGPQGEKGDTGAEGTASVTDGSITNSKIATAAVSNSKLTHNAISTANIQNNAVTTNKISNNAITANKIAPGVVTAELLADGIFTTDKIPDGAVIQEKLGNGSITTIKIAENAITKAKIAAKTLSGDEIEDNVVLDGVKIRGNAQLLGNSPAYFNGPTNDDFHIQSEANLIFKLDTNNNSNNASYIIKNGTDATLFSVDESGNVTINGNVTITGTVDGVDVSSLPTTDTNTQLSAEQVQDIVGAMFTGNTETRVSATYDDSDGTIDIVVDDMTTDTNTQLPLIDSDTMTGALSTNVASAESVKAYVDNEVAGIVDSAPGTLNTLNELADALGDDANFSTTVTNNIATKAPIASPTFTGTVAIPNITDVESAITANTAKTGITTSQANAITANTAKPDLTVDGAGTVHANNYTDTQYSVMSSANSYAAGLVPAGSSLHQNKFLRKDGTFVSPLIYFGGDGITFASTQISADLKANGGLVIESGKIALDLGASSITNNLTIPVDLTTSGTGTVHADNYTNTTYSEATSSAEGLMSIAHHDKLDGIASGATAYADADAVSAVSAADNYVKNSQSDGIAGNLSIGAHDSSHRIYLARYQVGYPHAHIYCGLNGSNVTTGFKIVTKNGSTYSDALVISGSTKEATFSNVVNCTKLNTGQGDNELYAMNQDVETTDSVTFNSVTGGSLTTTSSVYIQDSSNSATGTKSRFLNRVTTANRTLDVPDASGMIQVDVGGGFPLLQGTAKIVLSTANCNSLHTTPITLVSAAGANTVIIPTGGMIRVDRAATQTNSGANLDFHYDGINPNYFATSLVHLRRFMWNETGDRVFTITQPGIERSQSLTEDVNKDLQVSASSALTNNCFTSVTIFLTYNIINIS
mgnify:CR=1 FL=1